MDRSVQQQPVYDFNVPFISKRFMSLWVADKRALGVALAPGCLLWLGLMPLGGITFFDLLILMAVIWLGTVFSRRDYNLILAKCNIDFMDGERTQVRIPRDDAIEAKLDYDQVEDEFYMDLSDMRFDSLTHDIYNRRIHELVTSTRRSIWARRQP